MNRASRALILALVVLGGLAATATDALATHFRYGTITWSTPNPAQPNVIQVRFDSAWRRSFFGSVTVGQVVNPGTIDIFNSTMSGLVAPSLNVLATITSVNAAEDWISTSFVATVTLPPGAPADYVLYFTGCCRISTLADANRDQNYTVLSRVTIRNPINRPPTSASLPIVSVVVNAPVNFAVPAFDPDGDPLTYVTSPLSESGLVIAAPPGSPALTINATTGVVNWTPTALGLFGAQFKITDSRGASTVVDIVFHVLTAAAAGTPPTIQVNGSSVPPTFSVVRGTPLSFTVATTSTTATPVTLSGSGLPAGATMSPVLGTSNFPTVTSTFSWTPTIAQTGSYLMTFAGTSGTGVQSQISVNVNVTNNPPVLTCTPLNNVIPAMGPGAVPFSFTASVTDADNDSQLVHYYLNGVLQATLPNRVVPFSQPFSGSLPLGNHTYQIRTTDNFSPTVVCNGTISVVDATAPNLTVPADADIFATSPTGAVYNFAASATDAVDPAPAVVCSPSSGSQFGIGQTQVVCTASDASGNAVSGLFQVRVHQQTALSVAPVVTTAGTATMATATLTTIPGGLPIAGQTVAFTFAPGVPASATAVTDAAGVATANVTFLTSGSFNVAASFMNPAAFFTDHNGTLPAVAEVANATATVQSAASTLAPLTVAATEVVGNALTASTVLTRASAPIGAIQGAVVTFTLTSPSGSQSVQTAVTDATGAAQVTFATLTGRGVYSLVADYAGSSSQSPVTTSVAHVTVYQKTALAMPSVSPTAGAPVQVSATLTSVPSGAGLSGQLVSFDFGGAIAPVTVSTDANGLATQTVTFPAAATVTVTASFSNLADYFVDPTGAPVPTTANASASVAAAVTGLVLQAPVTAFTNGSLVTTSTLTRISAPSGPVGGVTVAYTITSPLGSTSLSSLSTTDPSGVSSVSAAPLLVRGVYTVSAQFGGTSGLAATVSNSAATTVYQRTALSALAPPAVAGTAVGVGATLTNYPSGTPIEGATVVFSFGGVIPDATGTTGIDGVATAQVTFPSPGAFPMSATFSNLPDYYADAGGALLPTVGSTTITVADGTAPVIGYTVGGTLGLGGWYTSDVTINWTVTDPDSAIASQTGCDTTVMNTDGSVTLTCSATSGGGTATASVTVKRDATAPVLTTDVNRTESATGILTVVNYTPATASDATSGLASVSCMPTSGSSFSQGATLVSCQATDNAGNESTGSFTVTVTDTTDPVFAPLPDVTVPGTNPSGEVVNWMATAADAVSGSATVTCSPLSGSTFGYTPTTVTCEATDAAGNTAEATFVVTVTDATPPVITPSVTGTLGANGWYTSDVNVSFAVSDAQSPITNTTGCDAITVSTDGSAQTITCTATSAGGTATASATFNRDATAPVVITSPALSVTATSIAGATVNYIAATATDAPSGVALVSCTPPSGATFAVGPTTVTCTGTDNAGNIGTASFVVTVSDPTPPVVTPSVTGTLGANGWYTSNVTVSFATSDPESGIATSSSGCAASTTTTDTVSTTISCTATSAGGSTTQSVTFKRDASAPGITVSPNKTDNADSWDGADVTYAAATGSDATSGIASVVCTPASGSTFPIGVTTVACVATNNAGLTTNGSFTVTVVDPGEPGKMRGEGHVPGPNSHKIDFDFTVYENRRGYEWGDVRIKVKDERRRRGNDERFDARTVDDVFFSNAPDYGPGRNSRTGIDTVIFRGTGRWDGQANYTYVVTASDRGEPGRGRDTFTIEIKSPTGVVVFTGGGTLSEGNVQSSRLQRSWSWWNGHRGNHWDNRDRDRDRGRGRDWD